MPEGMLGAGPGFEGTKMTSFPSIAQCLSPGQRDLALGGKLSPGSTVARHRSGYLPCFISFHLPSTPHKGRHFCCHFIPKEITVRVILQLSRGPTGSKQWNWMQTWFSDPLQPNSPSWRVSAVRGRTGLVDYRR